MGLAKLVDGVMNKLLPRLGLYEGAYSPQDGRLADFWGRNKTVSGSDVDEVSSLTLSAVFAAAWLLSQVMGMLPASVYRRKGQRKDTFDAHPAHYLLHTEPNDEMTPMQFRQAWHFHRLLWGNCYAEIEWAGNRRPLALWPIEPWRVKPKRDKTGKLVFEVDRKQTVQTEDILHVPLISFDGIYGKGIIEFARESLGLSMSAQEFAAAFFGNSAMPGGALVNPGNPPKDQRAEFRAGWQEVHGGAKKGSKIAALWGGWDFKPFQADPEKAQAMETRRFAVEEVARWFNIPPHLLRDLTRSTFSNIESQGIDFVVYTLLPHLIAYEQEFDRKLLTPPTVFCKHNVAALLRGDSAQRAAFYMTMFQMGVYTPNMILELEDENPVDGGDARFIPVNMQTLDRAINPPPMLPGVTPAEPEPTKPDDQPAEGPQPSLGDNPAFRNLLSSTLKRLSQYEVRCARDAANKPKEFLAWLDRFYARHSAMICESLGPVLALLSSGLDAKELADKMAAKNKARLLEFSGNCQLSTFARELDVFLAWWETDTITAAILKGDLSCLN